MMSLLIETMWSDPKWFFTRDKMRDYENSVQQVKDLRRALDVLLAQPRVDPKRIAYIGHDFGGMYGAVMAGDVSSTGTVRLAAIALQAATSSFSQWYLP